MTKKSQKQKLANICNRLARKFHPYQILRELSKVYEEYVTLSVTEPEGDFWVKCSRAHENLANGTEKWLYEMLDEIEDGET